MLHILFIAIKVLVFLLLPATGLLLLLYLGRAYCEVVAFANAMSDELSYAAAHAVKSARKIVVLVVGVTLIIVGVAMMVLPGPATVVIPLGLALLGTEFLWARRLFNYIIDEARTAVRYFTGREEEKE